MSFKFLNTSQENIVRLVGVALIVAIWLTKPYGITGSVNQAPDPVISAQLMTAMSSSDLPQAIAHAAGLYHGRAYTNSIEALEHSYRLGYQIQEVDLNLTTDHHIVLLHDWGRTVESLYGVTPGPRDHRSFHRLGSPHYYQPASIEDLVSWLRSHPTSRVILDTKADTIGILKTISESYPDILRQCIPYIQYLNQYEVVAQLGYRDISVLIYPGRYHSESLLAFAQTHHLHSIAMTPAVFRTQSPLLAQIVPVYCWVVNDAIQAARLREQGAQGVITDTLAPSSVALPLL